MRVLIVGKERWGVLVRTQLTRVHAHRLQLTEREALTEEVPAGRFELVVDCELDVYPQRLLLYMGFDGWLLGCALRSSLKHICWKWAVQPRVRWFSFNPLLVGSGVWEVGCWEMDRQREALKGLKEILGGRVLPVPDRVGLAVGRALAVMICGSGINKSELLRAVAKEQLAEFLCREEGCLFAGVIEGLVREEGAPPHWLTIALQDVW